MKEQIKKFAASFAALEDAQKELEAIAQEDLDAGETLVETSLKSEVETNDIARSFGKLFYEILEPINGYSPTGRRFSDGKSSHGGKNAASGPVVHKKIGEKQGYRQKVVWYDAHRVFDKLSQEHVDLVVDGKKARKDHREVAQDFLDVRNEIRQLLKKGDEGVEVMLSSPVDLHIIALTRLTASSYRNEDSLQKYKGDFVTTIRDVEVRRDRLLAKFECSDNLVKVLQLNSSDTEISLELPFTDLDASYKLDYSYDMYPLGWSKLLADSTVLEAYDLLHGSFKKAIKKMDDLKTKYAYRLMIRGVF